MPNNINYSNRGMNLENDLNCTNDYYLLHNIACIHKKPTPITALKTNCKGVIKEGFFKTPSTTDYNGIYKGHHLDFEAKETNVSSFPLKNIHPHQIKHLETIMNMGGISFIIVAFNKDKKTYLLETKYLLKIIVEEKKSITLSFFKEYGYEIMYKYSPRLDYLKIIDSILGGQKWKK